MKAPAFQFYADDFLSGTADMTNEEVGAYIRLLCFQWSRGHIPSDPARIKRMVGECDLTLVLEKFDMGQDGLLRNRRLEAVREEQAAWRESKQKGGEVSGKSRSGNSDWGKMMAEKRKAQRTDNEQATNRPTNDERTGQRTDNEQGNEQTTNPPSPPPSPKDNTHIHAGAGAGSELIAEKDALTQAANAAIDPAFAKYIYDTWAMRGGKDGAGINVSFIKLAAKRWAHEQVEWKNGTHNGNRKQTHNGQKANNAGNRNSGTMHEDRASRYALP